MKNVNSRRVRGTARSLIVVAILAAICGCGTGAQGESSSSSTRILSVDVAKHLMLQLPYRYHWRKIEFPKGATAAVAGKAVGRHRTVIHFGISFGTKAEPVPVPQSGTRNAYDYSEKGGFVFTDDVIVPGGISKQIQTPAQWREANHMVVQMQEKLCEATTGEVCPI